MAERQSRILVPVIKNSLSPAGRGLGEGNMTRGGLLACLWTCRLPFAHCDDALAGHVATRPSRKQGSGLAFATGNWRD